tara:strand:+ start:4327 stop:6462 length:2136 start_codon:yes stop_codon:yes gene_type:complete
MSIFRSSGSPNPSNLAAGVYLEQQSEKKAQKIADLNAQQFAEGGDEAFKNLQAYKNYRELSESNPESEGIDQEFLVENMPGFKNKLEIDQFLGSNPNISMGPSYITTFTASGGNRFLDEANNQKKSILGDRPDLDSTEIIGFKPEWSSRHQEHFFIPMIRTATGVEAAATKDGTPIVELAADGDMSKVQNNLIKLSGLEYDRVVNNGYLELQTQAGFSPSVNADAFGVVTVGESEDTSTNMQAVDNILGTSEPQTSETVTATGGTSYSIPGADLIQLDPNNPISLITKDNGNLVKVDATNTRIVDGQILPTSKEYIPLTEEGLEYVNPNVLQRAKNGEQFYVDPIPDKAGNYKIYDSSGQVAKLTSGGPGNIGKNALFRTGTAGADTYISNLTTGYRSSIEFETVKNTTINRENVKDAANSIPAGNRAQIRKAFANGDFVTAEKLISANTGENLLSEDDQISLLQLIQQSDGNLYSLSYDDKLAVAAAAYSAVPKNLRDADLAKSFTYFLETGKLDFNTRQIEAKEQATENETLKLAGVDRLNDLVREAAGAETDEGNGRLTPVGVSTMETVIRELSAMEADILATGNASAINKLNRQRINASGRIAADKLSEDTGFGSKIAALFTGKPEFGNLPPGDLIPNVITLDRNGNPTNDRSKTKAVQFIVPGTRTRLAGDPIKIGELTNELGSDEAQAMIDVGLYNYQLKQLGTK